MFPQKNGKLILECLQQGDILVEGQFMWGSNYTFLCQITFEDHTIQGVYKPTRGERPLWDFPRETLAAREVAAYLVSEAGGWDFVPPTVYREDGPSGPGSLQFFIDHDPNHHYFNFSPQEKERLRPVALFDAVINNTDRKGGHVIMDAEENIWLIDHGVCFHAEPKLRTVIWDFALQPIQPEYLEQIRKLKDQLVPEKAAYDQLSMYLNPREIHAMKIRIDELLQTGIYPQPAEGRYSYPWPPV